MLVTNISIYIFRNILVDDDADNETDNHILKSVTLIDSGEDIAILPPKDPG